MGSIRPLFFIIISLVLLSTIADAYDTRPLQDFCVADFTSTVRINGLPCKDPANVTADDFFLSGLDIPGNTWNLYGSAVTPFDVARVPGLNTLGLTVARLDFFKDGFNPPHIHPRGSEIITVLEGSLEVGFVTSFPSYKHFSKTLNKGDSFVVPVGLIHYQRNVGPADTVAFGIVNSQNAGVNVVANGVFAAKPAIDSYFLSRAFQLDKETIEQLQSKF